MVLTECVDSPAKAAEFLRLSLAEMAKFRVPPTPVNYSLFYERVAGRHDALREQIDTMFEGDASPDQAALNRLYRDLLIQDENLLQHLRTDLCDLVTSMSAEITDAGGHFSHYGDVLRGFVEMLGGEVTPETLRSMVNNVIDETGTVEKSRHVLEDRLSEVLDEVDELKKNLVRIREEAMTDALTEIPNRKALDERLAQALGVARAEGTPLCFALLDIDHFKSFNDTHGHLIGDKVLRFVATSFRNCLKGKDFPARFGGEEFAVILPGTPLSGAEAVADEIRLAISSENLKDGRTGQKLGRITISAGVAQLRGGESAGDLIRRADEALYRAKNRGRNRVEREAS